MSLQEGSNIGSGYWILVIFRGLQIQIFHIQATIIVQIQIRLKSKLNTIFWIQNQLKLDQQIQIQQKMIIFIQN